MNFNRLFKTQFGKSLISILLGLGISSLLRRACPDGNKSCYRFQAPNYKENIKGKTFTYNNECYMFELTATPRDDSKQLIRMTTS